MDKVWRGTREVVFNLIELGIFYLATVQNLNWAKNLMYFSISFCLGVIILATLALTAKPETARGKKKRVTPMAFPILSDIACLTMIVVQDWWFWVVLHTISLVLQYSFIGKWEELRKKYEEEAKLEAKTKGEIVTEVNKSSVYTRLIRPEEPKRKHLFGWFK